MNRFRGFSRGAWAGDLEKTSMGAVHILFKGKKNRERYLITSRKRKHKTKQ